MRTIIIQIMCASSSQSLYSSAVTLIGLDRDYRNPLQKYVRLANVNAKNFSWLRVNEAASDDDQNDDDPHRFSVYSLRHPATDRAASHHRTSSEQCANCNWIYWWWFFLRSSVPIIRDMSSGTLYYLMILIWCWLAGWLRWLAARPARNYKFYSICISTQSKSAVIVLTVLILPFSAFYIRRSVEEEEVYEYYMLAWTSVCVCVCVVLQSARVIDSAATTTTALRT